MVDIPLFLREEAERNRWLDRVDPLTEFQLQLVQEEKTTQEQAELWIVNNMGMPTYLQRLASIEDRYPYMPAAMQQRVAWSQSDMWLKLWTAAFGCKPVFTVLQSIFLAFYACGPVATIENIKLWVVHNFPWHSLGPAYLRDFAPVESEATISFFSGYIERSYSTIDEHIDVVLRRVMRSFTPPFEAVNPCDYNYPEAFRGSILRLVPGFEGSVFAEYGIPVTSGLDLVAPPLATLTSSSGSRLMALPKELLNHILDYAFIVGQIHKETLSFSGASGKTGTLHYGREARLSYQDKRRAAFQEVHLPPLADLFTPALVCKKFFDTVLENFFKQNTFDIPARSLPWLKTVRSDLHKNLQRPK